MPSDAYEAAAAREEDNALLAHLAYGRPLCGVAIVPLTWEHLLELTLHRNAFFTGDAPLRGDIFELLWRLNPCFRAGDGRWSNLRPGARPPGRLAYRLTRWLLARHCERLTGPRFTAALAEIHQWKTDQWQDAPAEVGTTTVTATGPLAAKLNQLDGISDVLVFEAGYTRAQVLASPIAWTLQLIRARDLASGDPTARARYLRPSAALIGPAPGEPDPAASTTATPGAAGSQPPVAS